MNSDDSLSLILRRLDEIERKLDRKAAKSASSLNGLSMRVAMPALSRWLRNPHLLV
jgi:hypothetical protein